MVLCQGPAPLRGPALNTTVTRGAIFLAPNSPVWPNYLVAGSTPTYSVAALKGWAPGRRVERKG